MSKHSFKDCSLHSTVKNNHFKTLQRGGFMRHSLFFVCLATIFVANNLMAEDRPTVTVTKDASNYYAWHCDQRLTSNDMDVPLDIASLAITNGRTTEIDTVTKRPSGFAGLKKDRQIKERVITYEDNSGSLNAGNWEDVDTTSTTNVPMIPIFVFGTFLILAIALRSVKAISPKVFLTCANIGLSSTLYIFIAAFLLQVVNKVKTVPPFLVMAGLVLSLITGILFGLLLSMGKSRNNPTKEKKIMSAYAVIILSLFVIILPFFVGWLMGLLSMSAVAVVMFALVWLFSVIAGAIKNRVPRKVKRQSAATDTAQ